MRLRLTWFFVLSLLLVMPTSSYGKMEYSFCFLGFGTYTEATGRDINNSGWAVGDRRISGEPEAILWKCDDSIPGGKIVTVLPRLHEGVYTQAYAINESGVIVGYSGGFGVRWDVDGTIYELPYSKSAQDINDYGLIAGENLANHAAIWNEGGWMLDLGTLPGDDRSSAYAINNRGVVAGESHKYSQEGYYIYHAFVWDEAGGMRRVGNSEYGEWIYNINDNGLAAGWVATFDEGYGIEKHAAVFDTITGEVTIFGPRNSIAMGINNEGYVVGYPAFLWHKDLGIINLNSFLQPGFYPGYYLQMAFNINDWNQITGEVYWVEAGPGTVDYGTKAFIMTPVPEPPNLAVMFAGFSAMGIIIRQKRK